MAGHSRAGESTRSSGADDDDTAADDDDDDDDDDVVVEAVRLERWSVHLQWGTECELCGTEDGGKMAGKWQTYNRTAIVNDAGLEFK
jgi:hypothetical protein